MNERPTPETDALVRTWTPVADVLDHARRLERERDEAREAFTIATGQLVQEQIKNRKMREAIREAGNALCACLDILGSPETLPHMLWKTDDEINAAWHAGKAAITKLQLFLD